MKKSKILALVLVIAMVLGMLPLTAFAEKLTPYGGAQELNEATNFHWSLSNNATLLTIEGKTPGRQFDLSNDESLTVAQKEAVKEIVIGENIVEIGNFQQFKNLQKVTIGRHVVDIDDNAFKGLDKLETVVFAAESVLKEIGVSAFEDCKALKTIVFPSKLETIKNYAFKGCVVLPSIVIPDSVKTIGTEAFTNDAALQEVTFVGTTPNIIGEYAFANTGLKTLVIPAYNPLDEKREIGEYAFYDCDNLESVTIGDNCALIGKSAFSDDDAIKTVKIGNVGEIGKYAFYGCDGIVTLTLGNAEFVNEEAFADCDALKTVTAGFIKEIGTRAFADNASLLTVVVKNANKVGSRAFADNKELTDIVIGDGKDATGKAIPTDYEAGAAFEKDERMISFSIGNIVPIYNLFGDHYVSDKLTKIAYTNGTVLPYDCFEDKSVYGIAKCYETVLTLELPKTLEEIQAYEQYNNTDDNGNEYRCVRLATNGMHGLRILKVEAGGVYSSVNNTIIKRDVAVAGIKTSVIPETVKTIGQSAFRDIKSEAKIVVPASVETIEAFAFDDSTSFGVVLPLSIRTIWQYAFDDVKVLYMGTIEDKEANIVMHGATGKWQYSYNASAVVKFDDVDSKAWYADAASWAKSEGIMTGYANGKFGAVDNMQRQDFVLALARAMKVDLDLYNGADAAASFTDVNADDYFAKALAWGVEAGIVKGYIDGSFGVGDDISREQIITFFYRAFKGVECLEYYNQYNAIYDDFDEVSDFAVLPMIYALRQGWINGMDNHTLAPTTNANRAMVAQMFFNIHLMGTQTQVN